MSVDRPSTSSGRSTELLRAQRSLPPFPRQKPPFEPNQPMILPSTLNWGNPNLPIGSIPTSYTLPNAHPGSLLSFSTPTDRDSMHLRAAHEILFKQRTEEMLRLKVPEVQPHSSAVRLNSGSPGSEDEPTKAVSKLSFSNVADQAKYVTTRLGEEMDKNSRRREMNRLAQQKSRLRKDQIRAELDHENKELTKKIAGLEAELAVWKNMAKKYENQLSERNKRCKQLQDQLDREDLKTEVSVEKEEKVEPMERTTVNKEDEEDKQKEIEMLTNELQRIQEFTNTQAESMKMLHQALIDQELRMKHISKRNNKSSSLTFDVVKFESFVPEPINQSDPNEMKDKSNGVVRKRKFKYEYPIAPKRLRMNKFGRLAYPRSIRKKPISPKMMIAQE